MLFLLCIISLFCITKILLILYPFYIFQNILLISLAQLIFIYCVAKIDYSVETSVVLFLFASLTVSTAFGYFYLPFLNGITWLLNYESRLCLELIVWTNFTIFKSICKDQSKHNILFVSWIIIGYGDDLWHYLN